VERRTAAVREAERAWRDARRRRLALERLRDRQWRRHQSAERLLEIKAIDELARLRYTLADTGFGGTHRDD